MDGEGTIGLTSNRSTKNPASNARKSEFCFSNGDERMILKCVNVIESIGISPYVTCLEPRAHQNLKRFRVCVSKLADIKVLTELMIPHLTSKLEQAILMNRYVTSRLSDPWINGDLQPDGKRHKATRRRISPDEAAWADRVAQLNDPASRASTTAREGAAIELDRRRAEAKARLQADRDRQHSDRRDRNNANRRIMRARATQDTV